MSKRLDFRPTVRPGDVRLVGRYGSVVKLDPIQHGGSIWNEVRDYSDLWAYLPYGPFPSGEVFVDWLAERAALNDPYVYAILDPACSALGVAALMNIHPDMGVIEVGHIVYTPALQRTRIGTEAQYLFASYAFDTLGYRRYEWKCNALNNASRSAAQRYGFSFEGIFRQHMVVKGRNRDTAWFSIIDREWPVRKAAFERWLSPDNFDAQGHQKARLSDLMAD